VENRERAAGTVGHLVATPVGKAMMTIERLANVDAAQIAGLNALFDEGTEWDAEQGQMFLRNPDNLFLLARWEGELCGFLTAHRLQRFDRRKAEVLLYEIGVEESYQRRGVGTALINEVKRWAEEVGADEIWVLTEASNSAGMGFYESTGGEPDAPGTTMFTYQVG
jgi:ribosomal protein S18 acetylase RimI-like enzyme